MAEVHPSSAHDRVLPFMCIADEQPGEVAAAGQPTFRELFEIHHALEQIISAAVKDGSVICPDLVVRELLARCAQSRMSAAELYDAVVHAATRAGVAVRVHD